MNKLIETLEIDPSLLYLNDICKFKSIVDARIMSRRY